MIDVTSTRSPPIDSAMSPYTFVEVTIVMALLSASEGVEQPARASAVMAAAERRMEVRMGAF